MHIHKILKTLWGSKTYLTLKHIAELQCLKSLDTQARIDRKIEQNRKSKNMQAYVNIWHVMNLALKSLRKLDHSINNDRKN